MTSTNNPNKFSDEFFRSLLESAPDAMVIVNQSGSIALVNGQTEMMFGYPRDELLGQPVDVLLPERLRSAHIQLRTGYTKDPSTRPMGPNLDLFGCRKDGQEFPVEISLSPIKADNESYVASVIRDVSSRKQLEEELIQARSDAEQANSANSAFLAAASHDLRQPVQALNLFNGALRRTVTDPKALEMIENQSQSLTAMTNLLNSLLDISRLDAGAMSAEFEEFPINQLVNQLESEFSRQAGQKSLTFSAEGCDAVVNSDPNLLAEILQNFISNSIRYTDEGGIRLQCKQADGICRIEVRDTGIGIDAENLERIFEAFYQCQQTGAKREGFGLGLAIVSRLAKLLDHKLDVESSPGEGSCFCILIPVVDANSNQHQAQPSAHDHSDKSAANGLVLLIEDDALVSNALTLLLETEGYDVISAMTQGEAMSAMMHQERPPHLIISDYHLGDSSNGVEAIEALRAYCKADIPALIITGDTSRVVDHARAVKNSVLLNKPVDPDHMLDLAKKAIRDKQVHDT